MAPQKPLTYRQLFATCESDPAKAEAIEEAYLKLWKHFEKMPTQVHLATWPETLVNSQKRR
jgi:hypothetical protein